jgi:hypothetical protein
MESATIPVSNGEASSASAPRSSTGFRKRRPRRSVRRAAAVGRVFGSLPLRTLLEAMNWRGTESAPELRYAEIATATTSGEEVRRVFGALKLREVLEAMNWKNAPKPPKKLAVVASDLADEARCVLEVFMSEINWD